MCIINPRLHFGASGKFASRGRTAPSALPAELPQRPAPLAPGAEIGGFLGTPEGPSTVHQGYRTYMYMYIDVDVYVYIHTYKCTYRHVHIHKCMYICIYV